MPDNTKPTAHKQSNPSVRKKFYFAGLIKNNVKNKDYGQQ